MEKKYCPQCGLKKIEGAVFCAKCGHKFEQEVVERGYAYQMESQATTNYNGNGQTVVIPTQRISYENQYAPSAEYENSKRQERPPQAFAPTNRSAKRVNYAKFGDRFIAFIIDMIFVSLIGGLLFRHHWSMWIVSTLGALAYFTLMEANYNGGGQTFGKKIMHIRTVDAKTLKPVDGGQAFLHTLGKVVFLPIDLIIGWIANDSASKKTARTKNKFG